MSDRVLPSPASSPSTASAASDSAMAVIGALTVSHLLNDMMQSVVPAMYPTLKDSLHLTFTEIGLISLANQVTASLLQPLVGAFTDRFPLSYALSVGMAFTFTGLLLLASATGLPVLMTAAALVGIGSSVFHPEASRIARLASGGRHGFAQSVFQVGGNIGSSLGPLLAAGVIIPRGQGSIRWISLAALVAMVVLLAVGRWYRNHRAAMAAAPTARRHIEPPPPGTKVKTSLAILGLLVFSKYCYMASLTNFYAFYLMQRFHLTAQAAQFHLFIFLAAAAAGTIVGGPVGDRIGRKRVIWISILGVAPFALALPHVGLGATEVLSAIIGFVLASAFSAILVFAQELVPGRVGMVSGLFFGFAFGVAGLAAAGLGALSDRVGLVQVYHWCAWLPLLGVITWWLPDMHKPKDQTKPASA